MKQIKWFYHPIFVFIFSIIALASSLVLYIYWYMEVSSGLDAMIRKFNIEYEQVLRSETWVVILVLSILVAIILLGIFTIFVYHLKTMQLYRLQHNFINNFTHELKTPVTSLKLYLETFLRHELPREDQIRYIRYMLNDTERLSENISRILNLGHIESKSYAGEFTETDLYPFIRIFYENNRHLFENAEIETDNPSGNTFFYPVNTALFEMLLMNLMTNTLKYNISEKVRMHIRFEKQKNKLCIFFSDNGIGFNREERKKIFRKFYQAGRSENMTARGSGLGLFLAQNIARIHKGKMTADSKGPGKGAVFTLTLPLQKGAKSTGTPENRK
ncbi:MAG: HAMP domain-containing sensor histidine kinase [Desulfococcaceae bacterium]|jgi:signal transduction histidine kinase|nr:HAMP domain-containing sensor histidine kinase [Desulfococcaceae bacterium]